jgi:hypothetical protein
MRKISMWISMVLYGYMDTNMINKGKRDEIIKEFYWGKYR